MKVEQRKYAFFGNWAKARTGRKRTSFLKKRSKKLLSVASSSEFHRETRLLPVTDKSFLVLFFKKEHFFLWLAALAGCASPDPTYYTLQPVPGAVVAVSAMVIEVERPGLAGYLDRSDIVLKQADYRLQVNAQVRWGEPLGDMIGRVLAQDLAQRLPGATVFAAGGAIGTDPDVKIEVDVQRFDAQADGSISLVANLVIESGRSHVKLAARGVAVQAVDAQPGPAGLAAAMSGLLGELADQAAADVKK